MKIFNSFVIIVLFTLRLSASNTSDFLPLIEEIRKDLLVSKTVRFSAYSAEYNNQVNGKKQYIPGQPTVGTLLTPDQRLKFFHNEQGEAMEFSQNAFFSFDSEHSASGNIYSTDYGILKNKVFIAFRSTFKDTGIFEKEEYVNNINKYYNNIINKMFSDIKVSSFIHALFQHAAKGKEYYFIGNDDGGSIAFLAAYTLNNRKDLKKMFRIKIPNQVKVITLNAPEVANAINIKADMIQKLGFCNVVHFTSRLFGSIEDIGFKIPLEPHLSSLIFYQIPSEDEMKAAIGRFSAAKYISLRDRFVKLVKLNSEKLIWFSLGCFTTYYTLNKFRG